MIEFKCKMLLFGFFMGMVWDMKNLMAPLDRAHRVVIGT
jgi:hypothetical protein